MRYDLFSLELFRRVADHKSISGAAEAANIAASAVSKRMSDLEHQVGAPLFYRQHRGVELTSAGVTLLRHATAITQRIKRMETDMGDFSSGLRGVIRIAANTSAITQFLPEDLAGFLEEHPELKINLKELTTEEILAAVRSDEADIGIYSGLVDGADLEFEVYRCDSLVAVTPHGHELAARSGVSLADLAEYDMVGLQEGSSLQAFLQREADNEGIALRTRVEVMSFDGVRRMVQAGLGVAILPYGAVEPYLESSSLCMVPVEAQWAERQLKFAFHPDSAMTKPVRMLIDYLTGREAREEG